MRLLVACAFRAGNLAFEHKTACHAWQLGHQLGAVIATRTGTDTGCGVLVLYCCSYYVPAQSRPELGQFFFAYSISIINEGTKVVMLERRHWVITDGNGKLDHVRWAQLPGA